MFRDLKEYQEIAKIYADKVSKPENLEERRGASPEQLAANRKDAFKGVPNSASNKRAEMSKARRGDKKFEFKKPTGGAQGRTKRPEVKKEPEYKPEKGVVFGQRTNEVGAMGGGKPSEGDFKKDFPDKPKISKFTKQGKERTKAQMMAAKRIGSGTAKNPDTTIAQVKKKNQDSMRAKAKERFDDFKAKRAAKKAEMKEGALQSYIKPTMPLLKDKSGNFYTTDGKPFDMEKFKDNYNKKKTKTDKTDVKTDVKSSYEYDAYDLVLEYLLSTEQAATIEEANYVMTEMDAETIQSIVEAQKKTS